MVSHTAFETRLHFENYVYSVKRGSREINETCCGVFSSIQMVRKDADRVRPSISEPAAVLRRFGQMSLEHFDLP